MNLCRRSIRFGNQNAAEVRRLQQQLGIIFVHVTNSQDEAMALADLVVVMNAGKIEQAGPPRIVFNVPKTEFVARFIGAHNVIATDRGPIAVRARPPGSAAHCRADGSACRSNSPRRRIPGHARPRGARIFSRTRLHCAAAGRGFRGGATTARGRCFRQLVGL
jgi:ABC-type glutathione transport system ATPase component